MIQSIAAFYIAYILPVYVTDQFYCIVNQIQYSSPFQGGGREVWKSEKGYVIASLAFHPTEQILVVASGNELMFWDWSKPVPFASCRTNYDFEKVR